MFTKNCLPAAIVSALFLAVPFAVAAPQQTGTTQAEHEGPEHEKPAELAAFQNVKISLTQAITTAEQHAGGGKVIDVSFEEKGGTPAYRAKIYHNNSVWEGLIDANTGNIVGQPTSISENRLDQEDKAELRALQTAKVTLAEAVKAAEQQGNGKAIDAGLEEHNGTVVYDIEIVQNGTVHRVMVDTKTGQITR